MSQCQLCLAYIKNIKQLGEEKKALQRQIAALRNLLSSKGIMLNSEGEEELEAYQDANPQFMGDVFEREREVKS